MLGAQVIILILCIVYFLVSIIYFACCAVDAEGKGEEYFRHLKRLACQVFFAVATFYLLTMAGAFDVVGEGPPFKMGQAEVQAEPSAPVEPAKEQP